MCACVCVCHVSLTDLAASVRAEGGSSQPRVRTHSLSLYLRSIQAARVPVVDVRGEVWAFEGIVCCVCCGAVWCCHIVWCDGVVRNGLRFTGFVVLYGYGVFDWKGYAH